MPLATLRRHHRTLVPSERPTFYPSGGAVDKAYNPRSETEIDMVSGGIGSSLLDAGSSGDSGEHTQEPQIQSHDGIECIQDNMNSTGSPATHSSSKDPGSRRHHSRRHRREPEDDIDETKHRRRKTESHIPSKPEKRSHGSVRRKTKQEGIDRSRISSKSSSPQKGSVTVRATDSQAGTSRRANSGTSKSPRNDVTEPVRRRRNSFKHNPLPATR